MLTTLKSLLIRYKTFAYIAATVVVIGGGYNLFSGGAAAPTTLTIVPADFPTQISVSGTVIAATNADLGFAASGRISGVYASVGQYVGAGALLAQVENGDLVAALAQKQAELDSLKEGPRPEEVAVAQASVAGSQDALINAIQSAYTSADAAIHSTSDPLFTNPRSEPVLILALPNGALKNSIESERKAVEATLTSWAALVAGLSSANVASAAPTAQVYLAEVVSLLNDLSAALNQSLPDQKVSAASITSYTSSIATARTNMNTAATALSADVAALNAAQRSLTLAQVGATASTIAAAQAAVDNARAALAKTRVTAPFSGVITRMDAKAGEIASPSDSRISIQSSGVFQIETFIPEVSIAGVAAGNLASTTLDAYGSDNSFAAKVISVDPAETVKEGIPTYKTKLSFLSTDPRIRSGMSASVTITTGTLYDAIVIPSGAIAADAEGSYVSVLEEGEPVQRRVVIGISPSLGQIEVIAGLSAGDTILLTPAL